MEGALPNRMTYCPLQLYIDGLDLRVKLKRVLAQLARVHPIELVASASFLNVQSGYLAHPAGMALLAGNHDPERPLLG